MVVHYSVDQIRNGRIVSPESSYATVWTRQYVPQPFDTIVALHGIDQHGRSALTVDWLWDQRQPHVVTWTPNMGLMPDDEPYMV